MTQFKLTVTIGQEDVNSLNSDGYYVALLQVVPQGQSQVVAVLAKPQTVINIMWSDTVYAYISDYAIVCFSTLIINSSCQANSGSCYSYNGSYVDYYGVGCSGYIQIIDNSSIGHDYVTAGLAALFTVNNSNLPLSILNAQSMRYNGIATIPLCFSYELTLLSNAKVGMVIPSGAIPDSDGGSIALFAALPALQLEFSDDKPCQNASYNATQNRFVATP